LKVLLTPRAESQLVELPAPAARRVASALRILEGAPRSGRPYPDDSPFRGLLYKTVVVKARRWSYRLTYGIAGDAVWIYFLYPSWYPPTHPGIAGGRTDED
jgi:mRNA-degrading endonuclease RelE of RelBE toxin-antitoxin system